jgi:hypothetical protein
VSQRDDLQRARDEPSFGMSALRAERLSRYVSDVITADFKNAEVEICRQL